MKDEEPTFRYAHHAFLFFLHDWKLGVKLHFSCENMQEKENDVDSINGTQQQVFIYIYVAHSSVNLEDIEVGGASFRKIALEIYENVL